MSDKYLSPDSYRHKYTKLIAELRAIEPNKNKWFKTKRGYPDWSFRELVEYMGFDDAVKMAELYSKSQKYGNGRLSVTSRPILNALE